MEAWLLGSSKCITNPQIITVAKLLLSREVIMKAVRDIFHPFIRHFIELSLICQVKLFES